MRSALFAIFNLQVVRALDFVHKDFRSLFSRPGPTTLPCLVILKLSLKGSHQKNEKIQEIFLNNGRGGGGSGILNFFVFFW